MVYNFLRDALRKMFHLVFADKLFLFGNLLQQMQRILKRLLCFRLTWFAQNEVYFEFLPRIVQRHAAPQPAVRLFPA